MKEQFIRGGKNPFKTLKIGKRVEIENWFKTWDPKIKYEIDDNLNIKVKYNLWLQGTKVTSLPDNLYVEGFLDLEGTNITSLPDNLHVGGTLDITRTNITYLPNNLHVGRFLNIRNTKITFLPDDLQVKEKIFKDF